MPAVSRVPQGRREPTLFDKIKMGALMGTTAGMIIGVVFGSMALYQYGPGPRGYLRTLGQYILGSSAMFGLFMSVGSVIRTEGAASPAYRQACLRHAYVRRP